MSNPTVTAAQALRQAANAVFDALETLAGSLEPISVTTALETNNGETKPEVVEVVETEPEITIEDIRKVLSQLSRAGRAEEAREFLKGLGYTKLPEIPEQLYSQILPKALELLDD